MNSLSLTQEQREKYLELRKHFFPDTPLLSVYWFEALFRFLVPEVAKEYAKAHLSTSFSFCKHAIYEKLTYELELNKHPVDLLYDIWKNPKDHRVDL
jgi:hypothetical protein